MAYLAESKPDCLLEQPEYPRVPKRKNLSVRSISREVDLSWLAGIIDGEGNLQATVQVKNCGNTRRAYFEPKLRITNTDVRMIRRVSEIYVREGIGFFYTINRPSRYQFSDKKKRTTWRDQLEISLSSKKHIIKALGIVMPYLENKRTYAGIMLEALIWVDSQPYRGRNSTGSNYTESEDFKKFISRMEAERQYMIAPSTTTRRAREVLSW